MALVIKIYVEVPSLPSLSPEEVTALDQKLRDLAGFSLETLDSTSNPGCLVYILEDEDALATGPKALRSNLKLNWLKVAEVKSLTVERDYK